MDVVLWGSLGTFIAQENDASRAATPFLLAGIILFWTFTQVQMTLATSVMEETWTRNLLNMLTTSVRPVEYLVGAGVFGLGKLVLTLVTLSATAFGFYGLDLNSLGWSIIPIVTILIVCGWALAFIVIGLILRFGQSAEILTWGINYVVLALSGVFFPIEALPTALRPVAQVLPTTAAFAAARSVLSGERRASLVGAGFGAIVLLVAALWWCGWMLRVFRSRGFVTRYS